MSRIKVILWTWPEGGNFTYGNYLDITEDVVTGISDIKFQLDQNDYDLGVFKVSELTLRLQNVDGKYLEAGNPLSVFINKRRNSVIEIYWAPNDYKLVCGFFKCGSGESILGEIDPVTKEGLIYRGLIDDRMSTTNVDDQTIEFKLLGFESILQTMEVNYSSILTADDVTVNMYTLLNQVPFTSYVTVSQPNITSSLSLTLDNKTSMEKKTVTDVLKRLLFITNSVLRINQSNATVYISPRTASASLIKTFYGQSSLLGKEDIFEIKKYTDGLNRVFNFWNWGETTVTVLDSTSVSTYGTYRKEITSDFITNGTKQTNILTTFRDEFRNPKIEFEFKTPMTDESIALNLLDKVNFDMPSQITAADDFTLAFYGSAEYDVDSYPTELNMMELNETQLFKILGKQYLLKENMIKFYVREI